VKKIIVIGIIVILTSLLSGCIEESYTDDEDIISFAKTIELPINQTENMTITYSSIALIRTHDWYSIAVYINYIDAPWNACTGILWFKMDGSNYFIEKPYK